MKKILLSIFLITFFLKLEAQTYVPSGEVKGRWLLENSPYIIEGDITLTDTLIIEPGVELKFKDDVCLEITGKLIAEGTPTDSIFFTNFANTWKGIRIRNSNFSSIFKYFQISGVRNIDFVGGALLNYKSNNVKISHGTFTNNSSLIQGGALSLISLDYYTISNLLFFKNSLYNDDIGTASSKRGTAVFIRDSYVYINNVTAVKNTFANSTTNTASTFSFYEDAEVEFTNCIIQENDSYPFHMQPDDQVCISNSNVQNLGSFISRIYGEDNYDSISGFVDFENDNFHLKWEDNPNQSTKPREIDGGLSSVHDADGSVSDIGAFPFDQSGTYFPPGVFFSANQVYINNGDEVQFVNNTLKGSEDIIKYYWDFGDGNFSTEKSPSHAFKAYGKFNISLTVTDFNDIAITKTSVGFIISGTLINRGDVSGIWNKDASPYLIMGDIIVPKNELLEINEGVNVLFTDHYAITVNGDLRSIGNEDENVFFTALDTLFFYDRNSHFNYKYWGLELPGWNGIYFSGNNSNSYINNSTFTYVRNFYEYEDLSSDDTGYGSPLCINNNESFIIENCNFINNNANAYSLGTSFAHRGAAIRSINSNTEISNCYFKNNLSDKNVIYLIKTSNSKILGNYFTENERGECVIYAGVGEKVTEDYQLIIQNNTIINNEMGGIICGGGLSDAKILVDNNRIEDNIGRGIYVGFGGTILVSNNWIVNNIAFDGGGISIMNQFVPIIVNNFISENEITYIWGQGSGILCETNAYIINNTLTKNRATKAIFGDNSTYTAINNILYDNPDGNFGQNTGAGVYAPATLINNYEGDPRFVSGESPKLAANSTCIDAGILELPIDLPLTDLYGNPRISGIDNKVDIGAVEYSNSVLGIDDEDTNFDDLIIYPNPTSNFLNINIPAYDFEKAVLYDISAKQLGEFNSNKIDLTNFKAGVYFIKIFTRSNSILNLKLIKN